MFGGRNISNIFGGISDISNIFWLNSRYLRIPSSPGTGISFT